MDLNYFATDQSDVNTSNSPALNPGVSQTPQSQRGPTARGVTFWTDRGSDGSTETHATGRLVPLPKGLVGSPCINCGLRGALSGALITPTADESDPNIVCLNCFYWRH